MAKQQKDTALDKGIPASVESERFCLGAAITDPQQALTVLEALEAQDFSLRSNQIIFYAMQKLAELNFRIDRVTVAERLVMQDELEKVGGISCLMELDEGLPSVANIDSYIRILKEKRKMRELLFIARKTQEQVLVGTDSPDEILDGLNRSLYSSFAHAEKAAVQSLGEYIDNYPGGINALLNPYTISQGILTGFEAVDELTDGFHDSEIFTIGASPGSGKTAAALGICENIARRGSRVIVFSLEMNKRSLFNRLVCQNAEVSVIRFRRGDLSAEERLRVVQATNYLHKLPLEIDDTSGVTVPQIAMKLEREHDRSPVSLFAIDFVQLMHSTLRGGTENDRLTEICTGLQNLCKSTRIPLLLLSQISRREKTARKEWRPSLESLRGSGSLEIVSNVVALIHRQEMYDRENGEHKHTAEWIFAKNREGETKTVKLEFVAYLAKFRNFTA